MPPCPTRNSNWTEDSLVEEVIDDAPIPSARLMETLVRVKPPEPYPSTLYNVLPDLTQALGQLADSLNSFKKPFVQAQVRELDQFDSSDI